MDRVKVAMRMLQLDPEGLIASTSMRIEPARYCVHHSPQQESLHSRPSTAPSSQHSGAGLQQGRAWLEGMQPDELR